MLPSDAAAMDLSGLRGLLKQHGMTVCDDGARALLAYLHEGGDLQTFMEWVATEVRPAG